MANLYTIENLLQGKEYRSRSLSGEIITAEKSNSYVYGSDTQAYLCLIRTPNSLKDHFRVVAVKLGDE
jgi:hypothetical protein